MIADKLIDIALTHFAGRGVDGASLEEIAADAGTDVDELRAEYSSTDGLFDAAIAGATRELTDDVLAIADRDDTPADRLVKMTLRLAAPSSTEATALLVLVRELLGGRDRAVRAFHGSHNEMVVALLRMIGEAQFRGQLVPLPPRFLVTVLLSGVVLPEVVGLGNAEGRLGGIHHRFEGPGSPPRTPLVAASIEALFNGILEVPIDLDPVAAVH